MRPILSNEQIHPAVQHKIGADQTLVEEIKAACVEHKVVVVGMRQNPVCKSVRKLLADQKVDFHYLEYGSYLSMWRPRLAVKMWTGLQTFPQVFINGMLIGGCSEVKALLEKGELETVLQAG